MNAYFNISVYSAVTNIKSFCPIPQMTSSCTVKYIMLRKLGCAENRPIYTSLKFGLTDFLSHRLFKYWCKNMLLQMTSMTWLREIWTTQLDFSSIKSCLSAFIPDNLVYFVLLHLWMCENKNKGTRSDLAIMWAKEKRHQTRWISRKSIIRHFWIEEMTDTQRNKTGLTPLCTHTHTLKDF